MDVLFVEQKKTDLKNLLSLTASPRIRLLHIYQLYGLLLNSNNFHLIASYIPEFVENYISCLKQYHPFGNPLSLTEDILSQIEKLIKENSLVEFSSAIEEANILLVKKTDYLRSILNGYNDIIKKKTGLFIPLLENNGLSFNENTGLLETFSISIKEENSETKFLISPSNQEIEKRIIRQIRTSWEVALKYVSKYIKTKSYHCVIIQFDNRYGEYVGDSLGAALTLEFIKELHIFYHSKIIVDYNCKIAVTGGLDEDGKFKSVSQKIVKQKTEAVFYSDINCFVLKDEEKIFVKNKLNQLQKKYPKRDLQIIGVEDIADLMNRRNVISVQKEKTIVRSARFAKRNWLSIFLILLFSSAFRYMYVRDYDDNPAILENKFNVMYVKNKEGKTLWTLQNRFSDYSLHEPRYTNKIQKIVDIDGDGLNEVVVVGPLTDKKYSITKNPNLFCFNYKKELIWNFSFTDTVKSKIEKLKPGYSISTIIDTITLNNKKVMIVSACNLESFSSAIVRVDVKSGRQIGKSLWNSGFILDGFVKNIRNEGGKELIFAGWNNGYEVVFIGGIKIDQMQGVAPSTDNYLILNKPKANLDFYILLPNTDYNKLLNLRNASFNIGDLYDYANKNSFCIYVTQDRIHNKGKVIFRFNYDTKNADIIIVSDFRVLRDSLVAQGKLSLPLTDTPEYKEILKNQIRYWDEKKFVTAEKYFNTKNKIR